MGGGGGGVSWLGGGGGREPLTPQAAFANLVLFFEYSFHSYST